MSTNDLIRDIFASDDDRVAMKEKANNFNNNSNKNVSVSVSTLIRQAAVSTPAKTQPGYERSPEQQRDGDRIAAAAESATTTFVLWESDSSVKAAFHSIASSTGWSAGWSEVTGYVGRGAAEYSLMDE